MAEVDGAGRNVNDKLAVAAIVVLEAGVVEVEDVPGELVECGLRSCGRLMF